MLRHTQGKEGFAPIALIIGLVLAIAAGGGAFYYFGREQGRKEIKEQKVAPVVSPTPSSTTEKVSEAYDPKWLGYYTPVMKGEAANYDYADPDALALPIGYRLYVGGGGARQIVSFFSTDGINWTREEGVRVRNAAFPDAVLLPDNRVRLYFQGTKVINSAISNDGLNFVQESGVRIPTGWHGELDQDIVAAPSVVRLSDGRYRMYYIGRKVDTAYANSAKHVFLSAISEDGLNFTPEKGTRIKPEDWLGSPLPKFGLEQITWSYIDGPEAVLMPDGSVKLYFWGTCDGICLSLSKDGLQFDRAGTVFLNIQLPLKGNAGDPAILQLKDGTWLLFYNSLLNKHASIFIARQKTIPAVSSPAKKFQVVSVTKDSGSRVSGGSVPFIWKLEEGGFRLYYCGQGGILSAISTDGLNFTRESGVRIAPGLQGSFEEYVCDPTLVDTQDGKFRMYYKGGRGSGGPGQAIHKIFSAISDDGLDFRKEGLRVDSETSGDRGWASVPDAILLPDERVRLYFVSSDASLMGGIMTMTAADGLNFGERRGLNLKSVVDPAVLLLRDGTYLLLAAVIDERFAPYRERGLYLFTSKDGFNFENEVQLLKEAGVFDPTGILLDESTIRIYYGYGLPPAPPETRSITVKF